jgi:hypothetical protein
MQLPDRSHIDDCRKGAKFRDERFADYNNFAVLVNEVEKVRNEIRQLREHEGELIAKIHAMDPPYRATYNSIGRVTVSQAKSRKWDNEEMWNVMTARARDARMIDKETGEVLESEMGALRRVIEECAYISYWKVTPLKETYGIDPDEYAETTSSKPSLRIEN